MRGFVPDLVAAGYCVVAFDGPAHGESEGRQADLVNFGGAIKTLIEKLDGTIATVITHSFGAACIVYTLANVKQHLHVDKLVLISASSSTKRIMTKYLNLFGAPDVVKNKWFEYVESKLNFSLDTVDVSTANTKINFNSALIIHDEMDSVIPFSEGEKIAASWKDTILVATKGYGHFRLVKNPDVVRRVVRFVVG